MKIVIIDYGMGNLMSIKSAFKYLGVEDIVISNKYEDIKRADKLILPGVGSFMKAMKTIVDYKLDQYLDEAVINEKKPILGICLGMQLLCKSSEEEGFSEGLGYINSPCKKFKVSNLKIPHVGFDQVNISQHSKLFEGIDNNSDFYFTHSYRVDLSDVDVKQSTCDYGEEFIASYELDNIVGTQFHPELSQKNGLTLLKNFIEKF